MTDAPDQTSAAVAQLGPAARAPDHDRGTQPGPLPFLGAATPWDALLSMSHRSISEVVALVSSAAEAVDAMWAELLRAGWSDSVAVELFSASHAIHLAAVTLQALAERGPRSPD